MRLRINMPPNLAAILWIASSLTILPSGLSLLLAQTPQPAAQPPTQSTAAQDSTNPATDPKAANSFAFPEAVSEKAAEAVKRGENPIPGPVNTSAPPPPAVTAPPQPDESDAQPAQHTPTGKLVLPNVPIIDGHEVGADGPDAPKDDGFSSSKQAVDPDDLDEAQPAKAANNVNPNKPADAPDASRRQLTLTDVGSSGAAPAHRVSEDLNVAEFYANRGNYMGAYLRYKDAIAFAPDGPEAHYGLASAAEKLGKRDEAIAQYQLYLKLDPDGDYVKKATRALSKLKAQTSSGPQAEIK